MMSELTDGCRRVEDALLAYGFYASSTRGTSMEPLFRTGRDVVVLERPKGELKKYDVALYRVGNKYIMHRVIRVRADEYLIRGDNTFRIEHVPKDKILGVLVEFNRRGREHSVGERGYRLYSRIWTFIYPVRFLWNLFVRGLKKIYRVVFKRKKRT